MCQVFIIFPDSFTRREHFSMAQRSL
uniref:Uncharacterized protein n=1 Tax=Arundo donax TaxID=35708 RepID=A0A0A9H025_ARUDO